MGRRPLSRVASGLLPSRFWGLQPLGLATPRDSRVWAVSLDPTSAPPLGPAQRNARGAPSSESDLSGCLSASPSIFTHVGTPAHRSDPRRATYLQKTALEPRLRCSQLPLSCRAVSSTHDGLVATCQASRAMQDMAHGSMRSVPDASARCGATDAQIQHTAARRPRPPIACQIRE